MAAPSLPLSVRLLVFCAAFCPLCATAFASGPEQVLYRFPYTSGADPIAGLVADAAGNLYGTDFRYGDEECECGAVFELSPPVTSGGAWTGTVIHLFTGEDGAYPAGTLILDSAGNVYGTTMEGGSTNKGIVFEFSPPSAPGGAWAETVIWTFDPVGGVARGLHAWGKLVVDALGNLYGTTNEGGNIAGCRDCGLIFELVKPSESGGSWKERVLYQFGAVANDGARPAPNLLLRGGILYGTTEEGGASGNGTVFQLTRQSGFWVETILHSFDGTDGMDPHGGLIADPQGNLYGTTLYGATAGASNCSEGCGAVYELSPPEVSGDPWQETTLYQFQGPGDGANPNAALLRDETGSLWGTAMSGGLKVGPYAEYGGTMFKLSPPVTSGGSWIFAIAHQFGIKSTDGTVPSGELILRDGAFYGTNDYSGPIGYDGTVFSYTP
jgi:uncharacterized repeat protein (TIGR03803 family)